MIQNTIKRPKNLSKAERESFDGLVYELMALGIDPTVRLRLIADYVKLESRIAFLTEREEDPELGNVAVSRALNVATAERRQLHAAIFAGARDPEPGPTLTEKREREAFLAWAAFVHGFDREYRDQEERDAREVELVELYGEAPMRALIIPRTMERITRESAEQFYEWMDRQAAFSADRRD